jgi:hypothetical protein
MRNKFEIKIEKQLTKSKLRFKYEAAKIPYVIASHYIPDFIVETCTGLVYIETKGYFRPEDKRKLKAVKKQHPELDIRFVFQNSKGKIRKGSSANAFTARYYDASPSPLSIGGGGTKSLLGPGGVIAGAGDVLGDLESGNFIGAFLKGKQVVKNAQQLTKASILNEGAGLLSGTLNNISANATQGVSGIGNSVQQGIVGGLGFTNGANLTQTVASKITGK